MSFDIIVNVVLAAACIICQIAIWQMTKHNVANHKIERVEVIQDVLSCIQYLIEILKSLA